MRRIQRNILGFWGSLLQSEPPGLHVGAVSPRGCSNTWGWTAPVQWHKPGCPPAGSWHLLPLCKAKTGLWKEAVCVKAVLPQDSQHRAGLSGVPSVSLGFLPGDLLWLSQQLSVAGNPSQVQKWHCFPSKEQMLPALLCCSNLWGWQTVLAAQGDCLK